MKKILIILTLLTSASVFAGFSFDPNENFDKCYELVDVSYHSIDAVNTCMEYSKSFQFVENKNFDKCYKLVDVSYHSIDAVNTCMKL